MMVVYRVTQFKKSPILATGGSVSNATDDGYSISGSTLTSPAEIKAGLYQVNIKAPNWCRHALRYSTNTLHFILM